MNSKHLKKENLLPFTGSVTEGMKVIKINGKWIIKDRIINDFDENPISCTCSVNKNQVVITEGYNKGEVITIPEGDYIINDNYIKIEEGYHQEEIITIDNGDIIIKEGVDVSETTA